MKIKDVRRLAVSKLVSLALGSIGILLIVVLGSACSFVSKILGKAGPTPDKERMMKCQKSNSARMNTGIAAQILASDYSGYQSYDAASADLSVARFCASRALVLSPGNYGATLVLGVISLTDAKASLYHRKFFEIFKKGQREEAAKKHLEKAKGLLGKAYVLRSGQVEPLYYLVEVSILEGNFALASSYLSYLQDAKYRPLDLLVLKERIQDLEDDGLAARHRKRKAPPSPMPEPRSQQIGAGKRFRIGVLSFGQDSVEQALPAMLLTALQETGRFQIFEGGGIRVGGQGNSTLTEATAGDMVDGYLSGTITSVSPKEVCFEVRLANARFHYVLYAKSICAPTEAGAVKVMVPKRERLVVLAQDIARSVKEIQASTISGVDDATVYVDAGASSGVVPGMVGYVLGTGSSVTDEEITRSVVEYTSNEGTANHTGRSGREFPVGSVYIISTEAEFSTGIFYREGMSSADDVSYAMPGDTVYFK